MTKPSDPVRRRIQANTTNLADGFERLQEDLLSMFISELSKFQSTMLERDETNVSILKTFVEELGAVKTAITAVNAGIHGLSLQLAEHEQQLRNMRPCSTLPHLSDPYNTEPEVNDDSASER